MAKVWCSVCLADDDLDVKCAGCGRQFHKECLGLRSVPEKGWTCDECGEEEALGEEERERRDAFLGRQRKLVLHQRDQRLNCCKTLLQREEELAPFVPPSRLSQLKRELERLERTAAKQKASKEA